MVGDGELFLRGTRCHQNGALVLRGGGAEPGLRQGPAGQRSVEIVSTQGRVTARAHHFKNALRQPQQGNVEGAAAQVVHGIKPLRAMLQAVGDCRCSGFADQAQHVQAGELRGVLGGLALGVIEVRGHGDDSTEQVVVKSVLRTLPQGGQDFGRHFDRRLDAIGRVHLQHAGRIDKIVRQLVAPIDVGQAAPHEAFHRDDGVAWVGGRFGQGIEADLAPALRQVSNCRRQDDARRFIRQAFGHAVAHGRHQGMRGAQVDAHGNAALVRIGRTTGFGNLQQRHVSIVPALPGVDRCPAQSAQRTSGL